MRNSNHLSAWEGIVENCEAIGLDFENAYRKTNVLLNLYRKTTWCLRSKIEELNQITYESCFGDHETLSYLLNFAPDKELEIFRNRAINAKVLLKLLNQAIKKVKEYPENGEMYYFILDLTYLSQKKYSESETAHVELIHPQTLDEKSAELYRTQPKELPDTVYRIQLNEKKNALIRIISRNI